MSNLVDKYIETVGALEMNTPETPYHIIMDEFSDDISEIIKQAGRYVEVTFLGYEYCTGGAFGYQFFTTKDDAQYSILKAPLCVVDLQGNSQKNYYLANNPDKLVLNGKYYVSDGDVYHIVENPDNPDSFTAAEFINTNYPKFTDNPYIVSLTYFTMNTTSDYRNMFVRCENLKYVMFFGACYSRYDTLHKEHMVVDCPELKLMGIADDGMIEVLEEQKMEQLETLITAMNANRIPRNLSVNNLGVKPFTELNITGMTDSCSVETEIGEYPFFVGNVKGSTVDAPVSVVIMDTENLKHGIVITD